MLSKSPIPSSEHLFTLALCPIVISSKSQLRVSFMPALLTPLFNVLSTLWPWNSLEGSNLWPPFIYTACILFVFFFFWCTAIHCFKKSLHHDFFCIYYLFRMKKTHFFIMSSGSHEGVQDTILTLFYFKAKVKLNEM